MKIHQLVGMEEISQEDQNINAEEVKKINLFFKFKSFHILKGGPRRGGRPPSPPGMQNGQQ